MLEVYCMTGEVRDNELDAQGIVNHVNYFIYMAHARHKHIKFLGIDFIESHNNGHDLIIVESNIKYKTALKSNDEYTVTSKIIPNGKIRINFEQEIVRNSDKKIIATGCFITTSISRKTGRPELPENLKMVLNL